MDWLTIAVHSYPYIVYPVLYIATIMEAVVGLITSGVLVREGYISFLGIFIVGMCAEITHDLLFWRIGKWLAATKRKKYLFFNVDRLTAFFEKMRSSAGAFIFFSKFAWNFNRVVLVSAGYIGIPLKSFFKASAPAAAIFVTILVSLGFFFADQTALLKQRFEYAGLIVLATVLVIVFVQIYIRKLIRKYITGDKNGQSSV